MARASSSTTVCQPAAPSRWTRAPYAWLAALLALAALLCLVPAAGAQIGAVEGVSVPLPRPVTTAVVTTSSLSKAVESGLDVRYSVNQQVAGYLEVLMPTRLARRLKVRGPSAKGLPEGTHPQTVIAYALLITIRQAHGTISIIFPPQTGARLSRLHHLTLTLRVVVRNAARSKPKATLLQTAVKLRG